MGWMEIDRRTLIKGSCGALLLHLLPQQGLEALPAKRHLFATASANDKNQYFFQYFDEAGQIGKPIRLPDRGHSMAYHHPSGKLVAFARRPGTFALVIDLKNPDDQFEIKGAPGRHFYGHGVFSPDGRWLLATENDYENGNGVVGVYDAKDQFKRVSEFSTHGIGPHEMAWLSDGKTLVVANGGLRTHPEMGRQKLNLPTMDSSLVYIDYPTGQLLSAHRLASRFQKMSIRHLTVTSGDTVALAMQYQGPRSHHFPLVGLQERDSDIQLLSAPSPIDQQMRNYCGSIASSGDTLCVSSPRGNVITFWSVSQQKYIGMHQLNDGCGLAPLDDQGTFMISSGEGTLFHGRALSQGGVELSPLPRANTRWDNHMVALGLL